MYNDINQVTEEFIAKYVHKDKVKINIMNVQQQENESDCDVFAIAFAKCLLEGNDSSEYDSVNPRKLNICLRELFKNNYKWYFMVGSWGRLEVGSAPSSDLVRSWGKTCGPKMGQPSLKTSTPSSDQGFVRRLGRLVLRPGRSEDGAQHIHSSVQNFQDLRKFWKKIV